MPLRHKRADLIMENEIFAIIHAIVFKYFSPCFMAINSASRLWYLLHSSPNPPVVVKTSGVNFPCSIDLLHVDYTFVSSHFRAHGKFALGLTLGTIPHLGDIPGYQGMQIFVFPKSLVHGHLVWRLVMCLSQSLKFHLQWWFNTTFKRSASRSHNSL